MPPKSKNDEDSRVAVPDSRLNFLIDCYKPLESVPAFLNVVDIAGLVAGASKGEGIGNAFLSHVKACDAIFHMIHIEYVESRLVREYV
ncbi:hypothetical protein MXB_3187 [Myxobolus squamalis]|nr:hypothetical protein MXB_3187 [Myxobolus squamalis]